MGDGSGAKLEEDQKADQGLFDSHELAGGIIIIIGQGLVIAPIAA